jgi:hypothetical protein
MKQMFVFLLFMLLQFSCKTREQQTIDVYPSDLSAEGSENNPIKDCPEVLIRNQMPSVGRPYKQSEYYIYKGLRRELKEFDSVWVSKHCAVKVIVAQ